VPDNATVWGLPEALSLIDRVALSDPGAMGVKLTLIEQVAFTATPDPQVLFCMKSVELVVMLLMVNVALPTFVKVMV
jgi:hypothetical protein